MIVLPGDGKSSSTPSASEVERGEARAEALRPPSPPPAYSSSSTGPPHIVVQSANPELPSAFMPPSPSSFPHPHPHTGSSSSGPTPLFSPAAIPSADYAYYDPRSSYSLALADRRAFDRFWNAFGCAIGVLILLWMFGLLRFGN
ncbi:hypothetical protein B0H16DRAFT_1722072 [Mycena metata]|uniref:Uncharacterized protein n=1 Tax=Mycena metata TaxID=1033252 RepID=A0AAD7J4H1_9AGAR|nr:hypothetical protein B0H16DRAFT_1722072 [Mycena metata]